ncbi:transposase family protein, partial [Streptomyces sp. NPDC001276]|uniref:helix-turn-helix domain-containing protein n=1 Tax=Streptomyces sp. NPDC001276 TaxID=3364555 RepID=UPI0036C068CD
QARAGPKYELVFVDRLLATLIHLRTGLTHQALAVIYEVGSSIIGRAISEILPLLAERGFAVPGGPGLRLSTLEDVFAYAEAENVTLRIDGTENGRGGGGCVVVLALTWAALELLDGRQFPVAAPPVMVLGRWFYDRHRHWGAGLVATVSGSVVVFTSVDQLRPHLDRLLADTTATAARLVVAMAVFTVCLRVRRGA